MSSSIPLRSAPPASPDGPSLAELARELSTPTQAPASFVHSQLLLPDPGPAPQNGAAEGPSTVDQDVDEWIVLDSAVARQIVEGGGRAVLRWPALALADAPRLPGLAFEAVIIGVTPAEVDESAHALATALAGGASVRAALAHGDTGIECYRAAAAARRILGAAVPIRARWDGPLDVKGAALALTFGADELAGPMAPPKQRWKLAQLGGPPEEGGRPSPAFVESLIQAAGRFPARRR